MPLLTRVFLYWRKTRLQTTNRENESKLNLIYISNERDNIWTPI